MIRRSLHILTKFVICFFAFSSYALTSPNVVLITIDDLNTDLGTYGHPIVKSPNIDNLARDGIRFDRAYAQHPQCTPSRSSFLTGLYPEQTGVIENGVHFRDIIPGVQTLPQRLKENGYFTARVGKIFHYGVPRDIGTNGLDDPVSWDVVVNPKGIDKNLEAELEIINPDTSNIGATLSWLSVESEDHEHTDGKVALEAVKLLHENHPIKTGKPFFVGVGFFRPHVPFIAPSKYFNLYKIEKIEPKLYPSNDRDDIPLMALADRPGQLDLSTQKKQEIIQAYYASVSFVDAQVGIILDALDALNLRKNTIVVLMSDHGYQLGQHGLWQKGDLFEGGVRAPLIISSPGNPNNGDDTLSIIEFVDLYPTIMDLVGLEKPSYLSGESLEPVLQNPKHVIRDSAFTLASTFKMMAPDRNYKNIMGYTLRTKDYRYTQWGPEGILGKELYDYRKDPDEYINLSNHKAYEAIRFNLHRVLRSRIEAGRTWVPELQ